MVTFGNFQFTQESIPGIITIETKVFGDDRGFFTETFQEEHFKNAGVDTNFVQDNHSGSQKGTLRGLHYQINNAQGKLVRAVSGDIFDVVVDVRKKSKTFGSWIGFYLSEENKKQVWIPPGFAHGFYVLSDWAEIIYKTTDFYAPQWERTILWNDPTINIKWPIQESCPLIISSKDSNGTLFNKAEVYENL